jgi:hypothetical protein
VPQLYFEGEPGLCASILHPKLITAIELLILTVDYLLFYPIFMSPIRPLLATVDLLHSAPSSLLFSCGNQSKRWGLS